VIRLFIVLRLGLQALASSGFAASAKAWSASAARTSAKAWPAAACTAKALGSAKSWLSA